MTVEDFFESEKINGSLNIQKAYCRIHMRFHIIKTKGVIFAPGDIIIQCDFKRKTFMVDEKRKSSTENTKKNNPSNK